MLSSFFNVIVNLLFSFVQSCSVNTVFPFVAFVPNEITSVFSGAFSPKVGTSTFIIVCFIGYWLSANLDLINTWTTLLFSPFIANTLFVIISVANSADADWSACKLKLTFLVASIFNPLYDVSMYVPVNFKSDACNNISAVKVSPIAGSTFNSIVSVSPALICFKLTLFPSMLAIELDNIVFLILKLLFCNSNAVFVKYPSFLTVISAYSLISSSFILASSLSTFSPFEFLYVQICWWLFKSTYVSYY